MEEKEIPPDELEAYEAYMQRYAKAEQILAADFSQRDLKEIEFCQLYADHFDHGTDAHNLRKIVAKFVQVLADTMEV